MNTYILYTAGRSIIIKQINIYHPDKRGGLLTSGKYAFSISMAWFLGGFCNFFSIFAAPLTWWVLIQIIGFTISAVFLLFSPLYSFHRVLTEAKRIEFERISKVYNIIREGQNNLLATGKIDEEGIKTFFRPR